MSSRTGYLSVLQLRFLVLDGQPNWPVVQILVDGREAFVDQLPGWRGFDPADILGGQSPLLPADQGPRVAVYRCSCGEEGCGVIAPVIMPSPDGRAVSWVDFRDYTGVFTGPAGVGSGCPDGRPWPFRDLHFDRGQYVGEIRRASADHCWETPRRATARLVHERLRARAMALISADLVLAWAAPARHEDSVILSFENAGPGSAPFVQQLLSVTSSHSDPEQATQDILRQLQAVPASEWGHRFGWQPAR